MLVVVDQILDGADIKVQVIDARLESFKSNKNFSLDFDPLLVVILIPDLLLLVELVYLLVEVSAWEHLTILLRVVRLPVVIANSKGRLAVP